MMNTVLSLLTLLLVSISYGQDSSEKIYESALFQINVNGKQAYNCNIDHHTQLTADEMIAIEQNYLEKEGVFKVDFNEQTIDVYFFDPVSYETIEDLANLYFGEFLVSKPKKVHINNRALEVSESE